MNAWLTALVVVGSLTVSALGGWGVVAGLLHVASRSPDSGPRHDDVVPRRDPPSTPATPPAPGAAPQPSVQRAPARSHGWAEPYDDPDGPDDRGGAEWTVGTDSRCHQPPSPQPSPPIPPTSLSSPSSPSPTHPTEPDDPGPLRGGTWIGVLERLAVTGVLLAGYPAGVAFVIAVKGLGRYPELREHPGSSERFVIGTLGSLVWSGACGVAGAVLLDTRVLGV